VLAHRLKRAGG